MNDQLTILFAKEATELLEQNKVGDAIHLCEQGVKQFPLYTEGHYVLGRCYQENDQAEEAANEFERVLNFMPGHLGALNALSQYQYRKEMYQVGNQLKLSTFLYHSNDEKLARYLINEKILPLAPPPQLETPPQESVHVEEQEETAQPSPAEPEEGPVVYEPAPEPEEELFQAPEFDRIIRGDEPQKTVNSEMLGEQDFALPDLNEPETPEPMEVIEKETAQPAPPPGKTESADIDNALFEDQAETPAAEPQDANEVNAEDSRVDLSRYANTQDDFSTLMDDMFVPGSENEPEEETTTVPAQKTGTSEPEPEEIARERPILDTSIIFLEKKQEDKPVEGTQDVRKPSEKSVQDDNTLASDIQKIPSPGNKEELPVSGPATNGQSKADDLTTVIEKIEKANQKRQTNAKENQEPQVLDSTAVFQMSNAVEDESVSIEDIMANPSLLTPTFGEILIAQKKFESARHVFMELRKKDPENTRYIKKLDFLDKLVAMNK